MSKHYQLADLIKLSGRPKTTLLRWEAEGKIPSPMRNGHGWRFYTEDEFNRALAFAKIQNELLAAPESPSPETLRLIHKEYKRWEIKKAVDYLPNVSTAVFSAFTVLVMILVFYSASSEEISFLPAEMPLAPQSTLAGIFSGFKQPLFNLFRKSFREELTLPPSSISNAGLLRESPSGPGSAAVSTQAPAPQRITQLIERREILIPADLARLEGAVTEKMQMETNKFRVELASLSHDLFAVRGDLADTSRIAGSGLQMVTISQRIDKLDSIDIDNGATVRTGNLTVTQGALTVTAGVTASKFTFTDTTSTSTLAGGLAIDTDTLVIDSGGNKVGIGLPAPDSRLHVRGGDFRVDNSSDNAAFFVQQSTGNVGLGTTSPSQLLSVAGHTYLTGGLGVGLATTTSGNLQVSGDVQIGGALSLAGVFSATAGNLTVSATTTSSNQFVATYIPATPHTFSSWASGVANSAVSNAAVYINPASAASDTNLLGLAVNGSPKFLVDAEGDIFGNSLTVTGSVTTGSTTNSSLLIEGSLYVGDAIGDLFSINSGNIIYNNRATSTIPNLTVNAWSIATSTAIVPTFTISTAASPFGLVGIGTTSPAATLAVAGSGYFTGGLGAGVSTTTAGNFQITGDAQIGGALSVGGVGQFASTITGTTLNGTTGINTGAGAGTQRIDASGNLANIGTAGVSGLATLSGGILVNSSTSTIRGLFVDMGTTTAATSTSLAVTGYASTSALTVSNASTFGGNLTFNGGTFTWGGTTATSVISSTQVNAWSIATSTTVSPFLSLDTSNYRIGLGTTSPSATLSIGGAGNVYLLGGLGVGIATTSAGNLVTSGILNITGAGTSTFTNGIKLTSGCILGADNLCVGGLTGGAANSVAFWTSASALSNNANFSFDNANTRLGVGTSTPGALFSLASLTTNANANFLLSGINMVYASSSTTTIPANINALSFATSTAAGNLTILSIDGSSTYGRVGVGTSTPGAMLAVENLGTGAGFIVSDAANDTTPFVIDASGNVGIGTAGPAVTLVAGTAADSQIFIGGNTDPGWTVPAVQISRSSIYAPGNTSFNFGHNSYYDGSLRAIYTGQSSQILVTEGQIYFYNNASVTAGSVITQVQAMSLINGMQVGAAPTGGDKGAGTINLAADIYKNNTAYTNPDYVFEKNYTGQIVIYADKLGAKDYTGLKPLSKVELFASQNYKLPLMALNPEGGLFDRGDLLLASVEESYLYLFDHEKRIKTFEAESYAPKSGEVLEPGDLVAVDQETGAVMRATAGSWLLGISMSSDTPAASTTAAQIPVAFTGKVLAHISTESGPIKIGDRITSSSLAGVGMKATKDGVTVGIALENFDGENSTTILEVSPPAGGETSTTKAVKTGKILVFVNLGYSKLDEAVPQLATSQTNGWSVDQVSSKVNVNFFGDVSLNGNALIGVSQIVSQNGLWRIDETGRMTMKYIEAEEIVARKATFDQFQLKDEDTNSIYCVKIKGGALTAAAGECALISTASSVTPAPSASLTAPDITTTPDAAVDTASSTQAVDVTASTTPTTDTSTASSTTATASSTPSS